MWWWRRQGVAPARDRGQPANDGGDVRADEVVGAAPPARGVGIRCGGQDRGRGDDSDLHSKPPRGRFTHRSSCLQSERFYL